MANGLAIFARCAEPSATLLALDLAMTALIAGEDVLIALFDPALEGWVEPKAAEDRGSRTLAGGLARCRGLSASSGSFTVLACGGAVERSGLDIDELLDGVVVDDVVGLPTIWRRVASMRLVTL